MQTIFKYTLVLGTTILSIPKGGTVLSGQVQEDSVCVWIQVDTEQPEEIRSFQMFGTGHPMPEDKDLTFIFIDTIQIDCGRLIFHIFEQVVIK